MKLREKDLKNVKSGLLDVSVVSKTIDVTYIAFVLYVSVFSWIFNSDWHDVLISFTVLCFAAFVYGREKSKLAREVSAGEY